MYCHPAGICFFCCLFHAVILAKPESPYLPFALSVLIRPIRVIRVDLPHPRPNYPRSAICSVTICVKSGFFSPNSLSLNLSTLLDQFIEQNFGPHIEQNAASL